MILCVCVKIGTDIVTHGYCIFTVRVDPFTKKEWYDVKAPIMFTNRNVGKTVVSKTQGKSMLI